MKNKPVVNQEVITLEELRKRFPSKKAFDEWREENKIYFNFDEPKQKVTILSGDPESFKNAKASFKKNQNNFIKKLKENNLLGLTKAEKIYSDTIKSIDKTTKRTSLIEQLSTANKEINLYKENCENEYLKLGISAYEIIDPEDFWNSVNKVNELVEDIKIKIEKLEHYEHEDIDTTLESSLKEVIHGISTPVDSFELDPEKQPTIDIHALSKYLGKNWSVSAIQKGKYKEIPDDCWVDKNPNRKKRDFTFITEKIKAWNKDNRPKPNQAQTEKSITSQNKNDKKHHFIFSIPLESFTNVFKDKDHKYLDEDNAILMNDRFSDKPKKSMNQKIIWEGTPLSLVTFIYLADRLDYIDRSSSANTRKREYSGDEEKEGRNAKEVIYTSLIKNNFEIKRYENSKIDSTLTRAWNGLKDNDGHIIKIGVHGEIIKLREKVAKRKNIESNEIKKKITRKEAIIYFFENKENKHFNIGKDIDLNILEIVGDYFLEKQPKKKLLSKPE